MMFKQMSGENTWAAVFSHPKLLREKLNEFLQTPNSVKIAQAAEKFFSAVIKKV